MRRIKVAAVIGACVAAVVVLISIIMPTVYTLAVDVSPAGAGSVSPSGGTYRQGSEATLTASPASGYVFDYWSGDASDTSSAVTITMDRDRSIKANFKPATYTLNINLSPSRGGSVSPQGGQYDPGTIVTLTAVPSSGYRFASWSGDISALHRTTRVTMNSDKSITANFVSVVEARVTRVIDGDTIEVTFAADWWLTPSTYKVRYIGIDTPETVHPSKPVECFGWQASAKNSALVAGKVVGLEKDVSETDRYGRLLRYVWVGDTLVNDYLVRHGYARVYTYPPDVKYAHRFVEAEREARENNRGLWATCE